MTPLPAVLALALAVTPSAAARRTPADATNAARARAGLLPRKPARGAVHVRRLRTLSTPPPTFLAEPAPPPGSDAAPAPLADVPASLPGAPAVAEDEGAPAPSPPSEPLPVEAGAPAVASGAEPTGDDGSVGSVAADPIAELGAAPTLAAEPIAAPIADAQGDRLVPARGTVQTTRLPDAPLVPAGERGGEEAALPAPVAAPEDSGEVRLAAVGVVTEATLNIRFSR